MKDLKARIEQDSSLTESERRRLRLRLEVMSQPRTIGIARRRPDDASFDPAEPPASVTAFASLIRRLARRYPDPAGPVETVSADEPLVVPAPLATQTTRSGRPARPREQSLEQRLLKRNGGNPVLRDAQ